MENLLEAIKKAVIRGEHNRIEGLVEHALDSGLNPSAIINNALITAMDVVGEDLRLMIDDC